jgi:hypothetical protein
MDAFGTPGIITQPCEINSRNLLLLLVLMLVLVLAKMTNDECRKVWQISSSFGFRHSFDIRYLSFVILTACINPSTFFASLSFQTRSTIFFAPASPKAGTTNALNFPSSCLSLTGFSALPNG